jgi:hypothetical protein
MDSERQAWAKSYYKVECYSSIGQEIAVLYMDW